VYVYVCVCVRARAGAGARSVEVQAFVRSSAAGAIAGPCEMRVRERGGFVTDEAL